MDLDQLTGEAKKYELNVTIGAVKSLKLILNSNKFKRILYNKYITDYDDTHTK